MSNSAIEKRRHARLPVDLEYKLVIDNQHYTGKITNISLGGTYLASSAPTLPVSCVSKQGVLNIKTSEKWVSLRCEIVYVGTHDDERFPVGAGVAFCEDDEDNSAVIWNLAIHFMSKGTNLF